MSITKYTQTVLPERGNDDDVPAVLAGIWDHVDPHFVLYAASSADLTTVYADLPAGAFVTCEAEKSTWLKTSSSTTPWLLLSGDSGWVTAGFTPTDNNVWSIAYSRYRITGGVDVDLHLGIERGTNPINVGSNGFVPDEIALTVPSAIYPTDTLPTVGSGPTGTLFMSLYSDGLVRVKEGVSNSLIGAGDRVVMSWKYKIG